MLIGADFPKWRRRSSVRIEAERAGRVKGRARVAFHFTSLRHHDERMSLRTEPIVHEAEATKGEDAAKIGMGAGAGALVGGSCRWQERRGEGRRD